MQVTLSAVFTVNIDNSVRYTTNGTDPTITSTLYTDPFTLLPGQHTIKAKSFITGIPASSVSSAEFTVFDSNIVDYSPTISPVGGIFNAPVTVTLESDTDGVALIMYTLDASDPATSPTQTLYSGPFELQASQDSYFIKAKAWLTGTGYSTASSATFTVVDPVLGQVATPTITPESGEYNNSISVSVQATDFSSPFNIRKLYVTRNGDLPFADFSSTGSGASGVYNFNLSTAESVKALAAQAAWLDSDVTENIYSFKCATPEISEGGTFVDSTSVSIGTTTTNATIYYTLNGTEPTSSDLQYSSPITITQDQVVKAMCTRNNFTQSDASASVFIINATAVIPSITLQPQSQIINNCGVFLTSVTAIGTQTLQYQWYKNSNIIGAANDSQFAILEVKPDDLGDYHVEITNQAGTVSSEIATLIVPIFSSGFEAGENNSSCTANPNMKSNDQMMIKNINERTQLNLNRTADELNHLDGHLFQRANKISNQNIDDHDRLKQGDFAGGIQQIPTINIWSQILLFCIILTTTFRFYIKRK